MSRGSKPGERRGGRLKGTRNRATIEKARIAELEIDKAKETGRKLAKEYLQDFLPVLAGMAATYQPLPPGMIAPNGRQPDDAKFEKWLNYVIDVAAKLAPYESPTFRAVVVADAGKGGIPIDIKSLTSAQIEQLKERILAGLAQGGQSRPQIGRVA